MLRCAPRCAVAVALALAVAAVYGQTGGHEFITYDDDVYILNNEAVTGRLSWPNFLWAFGIHAGNWHPLTWLSHMLDARLFGLWAGGHHLVGAGIHAVNAMLLFAVLAAMSGAFWPSAAVAAVFALHPLRVESVAWAAERKDVLSAMFGLLALGAYLRYVRRPAAGRYLAVLGLYALSLSAKPTLVTLPFVLLLLDGWPLGRVAVPGVGGGARPVRAGAWWGPLLEKVPLLVFALVSSLVTLQAQTRDVLPMVRPDAALRLANAIHSYALYLGSFIRPSRLACLYPYPPSIPAWQVALAGTLLLLISVVVLALGRRRPYLPVGWCWYLGVLFPVIGLVQAGGQSRSDRYTYLSMIGVTIALAWAAKESWPRRRAAGRALAAAFAVTLVALGTASFSYAHLWRTSVSLFEYTVGVTENNYLIMNNLGSALLNAGRVEEAARALEGTLRIKPTHCNARYNLGNALLRLHRYRDALLAYQVSLQCYVRERRLPAYIVDTLANLGTCHLLLGQYAQAEGYFREVLRIAPNDREARIRLGEAQARQGKGFR